MCEVEREPRIAVSVDIKLNLGNYESMGASVMLSGLRADVTGDEVDTLLETSEIAFERIRLRLRGALGEARAKHKAGSK